VRASDSPTRPGSPHPGTGDGTVALGELVHELVTRSAGLVGKRHARVEMVSPLIDGDSPPVGDRLAGDFLFHFGGFLDEEFRRHDFLVGWSNMRTWLGRHAPRHGFEPALEAVDRRLDQLGWTLTEQNPSVGSLTVGQKLDLARAAAHVGRVIAHDLADLVGHDDEND